MNRRIGALLAAAVAALALVAAPVLAAATAVRPRLSYTQATQAGRVMYVTVGFKVPKRDSTFPAKATVCATGKCETTVITTTGLPASEAQATGYTPSMHRTIDEVGRRVKVTTTLTIGHTRYRYTSSARDRKSLCGSVVAGRALPHC